MNQFKNEIKLQVVSVGELLRLTSGKVQWDVDPKRGYLIVSDRVVTPGNSKGEIVRIGSYEPIEILPGIWISKHAVREQTRNGNLFLKMTGAVELDSVRINQPIDAKAFEINFPKGTLVENMITKTSEFVGGRNSRDRKSVEKLAAANNTP